MIYCTVHSKTGLPPSRPCIVAKFLVLAITSRTRTPSAAPGRRYTYPACPCSGMCRPGTRWCHDKKQHRDVFSFQTDWSRDRREASIRARCCFHVVSLTTHLHPCSILTHVCSRAAFRRGRCVVSPACTASNGATPVFPCFASFLVIIPSQGRHIPRSPGGRRWTDVIVAVVEVSASQSNPLPECPSFLPLLLAGSPHIAKPRPRYAPPTIYHTRQTGTHIDSCSTRDITCAKTDGSQFMIFRYQHDRSKVPS
nr:hypothetical protein CFP56_11690 [Quercus suber]